MMMVMEGIKGVNNGGGGGGGRVGAGQDDDMGDGFQCSDHPYRNNPGGICAFCLQEKLGKLVSSSFPLPIRGSTSSSSSPSFRSEIGVGASSSSNGGSGVGVGPSTSLSMSLSVRPTSTKNSYNEEYYTRRARLPFLLAKKKKKTIVSSSSAADVVFKRSKSTTTPRRGHFLEASEDFSPRKRTGFWSFLYHSSSKSTSSKKIEKGFSESSKIQSFSSATSSSSSNLASKQKEKRVESCSIAEEEDESPNSQTTASASSFDRKVSRSRSVGCGSRSFSGDFFERISTGFGDCTLRRVESQREGKPKISGHRAGAGAERVKCGGIFGGFILTSSSSSSSSSSYWVSSSAEDLNGKPVGSGSGAGAGSGSLVHGRSRSWGWAFASPMRAFSKPGGSNGRRDIIRQASDKNTTPNLAAIPSLLAVRG
ncbi:hypothetical protein UlMin_009588 [Ulmus minor]